VYRGDAAGTPAQRQLPTGVAGMVSAQL
jgi:hypothetical protein